MTYSSLCAELIDCNRLGLTNPMSPSLSLQHNLRIPILIEHDACCGSCKVDSETSGTSGDEHDAVIGVLLVKKTDC